MPRRSRPAATDSLCHVVAATVAGEPFLAAPAEVDRWLELVRELARREGWTIFAFAVGPSWYELAIATSERPLARGMRSLQGRFAQGYNRRHERCGPLWSGRYRAALVDRRRDLAELVVAVHAGAVASAARSGHDELLGDSEDGLVAVDEALAPFGASIVEARRAYRAAVERELAMGTAASASVRRRWWQIAPPAPGGGGATSRSVIDAGTFLEVACRAAGGSLVRLASRRRDRETVRLRVLVATVGAERFRLRVCDLAAGLAKHPDWVSRWVCRGAEQLRFDPGFRAEAERLAHRVERVLAPPAERPPRARRDDWAMWMK